MLRVGSSFLRYTTAMCQFTNATFSSTSLSDVVGTPVDAIHPLPFCCTSLVMSGVPLVVRASAAVDRQAGETLDHL